MNTSIKRYPAKEHHQPVERICRTLELRDDPQLIAEYRRRHSQGAIWPEIPAGIREAGILEMEIYLLDPGSTAAEKWQPMERIFHLYD